MGVIKASSAPKNNVAPFTMRDVEAHANAIINRAREQAEQLLSSVQAEADRIREEAREAGYQEGRAAGLKAGRDEGLKSGHAEALSKNSAKLEALITALSDSASKLEASRKKLESETVFDVIRLAVAIARRVTKALGDVNPGVARANVEEALRMVVNASGVKVVLHPSQLATMQEELPNLKAMFPKLQQVELVGDPSLAPGGCRLLAGSGIVDADLDTQLSRVVADLMPPGFEAPV